MNIAFRDQIIDREIIEFFSIADCKERFSQVYRKHKAQVTHSPNLGIPICINVEVCFSHPFIPLPFNPLHRRDRRGVNCWADGSLHTSNITQLTVAYSPPTFKNQEAHHRIEEDTISDPRLQPVVEDLDLPTLGCVEREGSFQQSANESSSSAVGQHTLLSLQVKPDITKLKPQSHIPPVAQPSTSHRIDLIPEPLFANDISSSKRPLKRYARATIEGSPYNIECWAIQNKDIESQPGVRPTQQEQVIPDNAAGIFQATAVSSKIAVPGTESPSRQSWQNKGVAAIPAGSEIGRNSPQLSVTLESSIQSARANQFPSQPLQSKFDAPSSRTESASAPSLTTRVLESAQSRSAPVPVPSYSTEQAPRSTLTVETRVLPPGSNALPQFTERPPASGPVPRAAAVGAAAVVGAEPPFAVSESAAAAEARIREDRKRMEKEAEDKRIREMEGQRSIDIERSPPEQQLPQAPPPVPDHSRERGGVYHHRYDHLKIPSSIFEIIRIGMQLTLKGKPNAEWLNSVALAVGGFYCTNNSLIRCTGCTYEIEVKALLARLKPHQKPFFCFAQLFCELSYPADHAVDCCWSVHLHRAAVEICDFLNKFAAPGVASRAAPKLPVDLAIAASSNEDAVKYRASDVLFYTSKIAEHLALVEAPEYEFFRPIYNQPVPPPLRVQDITALKLSIERLHSSDEKVKTKTILDYVGSGPEVTKVELGYYMQSDLRPDANNRYSLSLAEARRILRLVKFTRDTSDNPTRDAEALSMRTATARFKSFHLKSEPFTKTNEPMLYFGFLLASRGIYLLSFTKVSISQSKPLFDMRFACAFCKNTFFVRFARMNDIDNVVKSFNYLWHRHFIRAPTCPMSLNVMADNVDFTEEERLRVLKDLPSLPSSSLPLTKFDSKFATSAAVLPAVSSVPPGGYRFVRPNELCVYSSTANGYVDKFFKTTLPENVVGPSVRRVGALHPDGPRDPPVKPHAEFLYTQSVLNEDTEELNCDYMAKEPKVWDTSEHSMIDFNSTFHDSNDEVLRSDINEDTILSDASRDPISLILGESPIHSEYVNLETRVESYILITGGSGEEPVSRWPHEAVDGLSSRSMAKCGFFMPTATPRAPVDLVTCYHCGLEVSGWHAGNDPVVEHVRRSPLCPHLIRFRGFEFVANQIKDGLRDLRNGLHPEVHQSLIDGAIANVKTLFIPSPLGLRPRADQLTDARHFRARIDLETSRFLIEQLEIPHELVQYCYERQLNSPFKEEFLGVQELVLFALLMQGAMLEMGLNAQGYIEQQRAYQEILARNPDAAPVSSLSSIRPTRGESQFDSIASDDEDNASDADGDMIDRRPDLNTGAGYTPATGTGVPNNAPAPDSRNQNSFSQSTIHDPGRPLAPRAGPANSRIVRTSSPSSGRTDGTRSTNETLDLPPPRVSERAPATQAASASASSKVAPGDMPAISLTPQVMLKRQNTKEGAASSAGLTTSSIALNQAHRTPTTRDEDQLPVRPLLRLPLAKCYKCNNKEPRACAIPCGHKFACDGCCQSFTQCPACFHDVKSYQIIYNP